MSMRWKIVIGIVISGAFVAYAVSRVDFAEMGAAFSQASYIWTVPVIISVIVSIAIRALRWRWLLLPIRLFKFPTLFSSVMIGFMANNLLPARIGEVVRAISLSKKHDLSRSAVFATVVGERIFDSIGLLTVFYLSLIFIDYPDILKQAGLVALLMTIAAVIVLYLLKVKTEPTVKIIIRPIKMISLKLADRIESIALKFADGLSVLTEPVPVLIIYLYSVVLWLFTGLTSYLVFISFGLYPSLWASIILLLVSVLAVTLPSSPGYIGTFHAACLFGFDIIESLGMFGEEVSKSVALSFSVVLWSCQFFPITLMGLYYFKKEHLKFGELKEESI
jgi:uncharacterized protein (TIRG00374 family)